MTSLVGIMTSLVGIMTSLVKIIISVVEILNFFSRLSFDGNPKKVFLPILIQVLKISLKNNFTLQH